MNSKHTYDRKRVTGLKNNNCGHEYFDNHVMEALMQVQGTVQKCHPYYRIKRLHLHSYEQ